MTEPRISRDRRRRFHWHEYFLALRRRDRELANFHRQAAQKAAGKPAAAVKTNPETTTAAGSISSSKATKVESVVLTTSDQVDRHDQVIKRKLRKGTITQVLGCTQHNACEDLRLMDSCCWVAKDLCSACLTYKEFRAWWAGRLVR